jgi:hypothetical protein
MAKIKKTFNIPNPTFAKAERLFFISEKAEDCLNKKE